MESKIEHCPDCGVCVMEVDHHCGVFDRCIAMKNLRLFYSVLCLFFANLAYMVVSFMSITTLIQEDMQY